MASEDFQKLIDIIESLTARIEEKFVSLALKTCLPAGPAGQTSAGIGSYCS